VHGLRQTYLEIVLDVSEVLLGVEAQVQGRFGLFGDGAHLDTRLVHHLRQTYDRLRNRFGRTRWYTKV
jgi:hypothetical protein